MRKLNLFKPFYQSCVPCVQFTFNVHPKQFYLGVQADQMKEQKVRPRKHLCHKYTSVKKNRERNPRQETENLACLLKFKPKTLSTGTMQVTLLLEILNHLIID